MPRIVDEPAATENVQCLRRLYKDAPARFPGDSSRSAAVRGFCYRFLLAYNGIELRPEYKPLFEPPAPKVLRALPLAP
jgi:hypothetical protein